MKTLYIECNMGAAGDMLMAALLELLETQEDFLHRLNHLMPEGVSVHLTPSEKCGVNGSHVHVLVHGAEEGEGAHHHGTNHGHDHGHTHFHDHPHSQDHAHPHSGLSDIEAMIDAMEISETVKTDAKAVYQLIAEAESKVHGKKVEQVHFHEVGTLDAVADVVGTCLLMEEIGPQRIVVSPVHVGCGSVQCAHGQLPVPAPATALLLAGLPIYGGTVEGELCTPTGAALLKYFGDAFAVMPAMTVEKIGYGMGTKDFADRPNCVRVLLGHSEEEMQPPTQEDVIELAANIDDMTGEELGFAMERLLAEGALDVYFEQIVMKKSRPAVKLVCMCQVAQQETFAAQILKYTTTIGVRASQCRRFVMDRHTEKRQSPWGEIDVKVSSGYGVTKEKVEFDQVAAIAKAQGLSISQVKKEIK